MILPEFKEKKRLFDFLATNKDLLVAQKKSVIKKTDGYSFFGLQNKRPDLFGNANKGVPTAINDNELFVRAVINTTNIFDSHTDVHAPGIWTKTMQENKNILFAQEHNSDKFSNIIASGNDLKAYVDSIPLNKLGIESDFIVQALIFDAIVKEKRNKEMYENYLNGYVNAHSCGMVYVKVDLAINDSGFDEYQTWLSNVDTIYNKADAENNGFFWLVREAKLIEGSAVPLASNTVTPTIQVLSDPQNKQSDYDNTAALALITELKKIRKHLKN